MTETYEQSSMQLAEMQGEDLLTNPAAWTSQPSVSSASPRQAILSPPTSQAARLTAHVAAQSSLGITRDRELTPPPTTLSSQEQETTTTAYVPSVPKEALRPNTESIFRSHDSSRSSSRSPPRPDVLQEVLSGPKRTASGQIKRSSITSLNDLKSQSNGTRPSRTSTLTSIASSGGVMELSQQLRTRLNYAMVKVQNGWQTRSLEEVESLASQSPRSSTSGFQHLNNTFSPRSVLSSDLHRKWSSSESSEGPHEPALHRADPAEGLLNGIHQVAGHGVSHYGLAPPVDIVPRERRRPASNSSNTAGATSRVPPASLHVNTRPQPKLRTPSQTAGMEADAVETLMFMASPNHSGHHPPTFTPQQSSLRSTQHSQTSPLRSHFSVKEALVSPKRVAFASTSVLAGKPYERIADIERMLDEFSDDDSSDGLEEAYGVAQHQRTAEPIR